MVKRKASLQSQELLLQGTLLHGDQGYWENSEVYEQGLIWPQLDLDQSIEMNYF